MAYGEAQTNILPFLLFSGLVIGNITQGMPQKQTVWCCYEQVTEMDIWYLRQKISELLTSTPQAKDTSYLYTDKGKNV
jgi:hypothetical protein